MDKEIIIDGVKVEECSYYNKDNTPYCCEVWDNECEAQNCYYKQLKRLEQENAELKAENEALIEGLCVVNKYVNKYHQTLQEIKAIAEAPKPFIDFSGTKTATEIEYDYAAICNELELRLHKVLELITKAEEE